MKINKKYTVWIWLVLTSLLLTTYAEDVNTLALSSPNVDTIKNLTGSGEVSQIINRYEDHIKASKDGVKLKKLFWEKDNFKGLKLSQALKDDILTDALSGVQLKDMKQSLKVIADVKKQDVAFKMLVDSTKKDAKQSKYKLYVKSDLNINQIKDIFNFFDSVDVSNLYVNVYEINFTPTGKFWKYLVSAIETGNLPAKLFDKIEIVQPTFVESVGTFLNGESSTLDWWISKIWAQNYQEVLSKKQKIKVWVIDTGINLTHPDLVKNIYTNTKEIAGNGVDDDTNGYIDDVNGYNFASKTANAADDHGHGSHVAGVIAASVNAAGIYGVNSNASLVPLKVLTASWYGSSYDIVNAIKYAADNGITVINMSLWGSWTPSTDPMCSAISYAKSKGTISVVAAGNENADVSAKVPAGCADAITVGAVDNTLTKASFSNYGTKVDVAAPGVNIYSTYLGTQYVSMNGTSMASPFVAWLVSSVLASTGTVSDIKTLLISTWDSVSSSVNIWKFINMKNVMTKLWVWDDSTLGSGTTTPPTTGSGSTGSGTTSSWTTNLAPVLSLTWVKLSTNNYEVRATASDPDGTISWYKFFNSGVQVYSGALNTYKFTITKDTIVQVYVFDNKWASTTQSVTLKYEAPVVTNTLPTVTTTYSVYQKNYFQIVNNISDKDGYIKEFQIYINNQLYYNYTNLAYKSIGVTFYINKWSYNVRVVVKDDKWWITDKTTTVK